MFEQYRLVGEELYGETGQRSEDNGYRAGRTYTVRWNRPVFGPAFPAGAGDKSLWYMQRVDNSIYATLPLIGDGTPGHLGFCGLGKPGGGGEPACTTLVELYRDGKKIYSLAGFGELVMRVPPGAASYRFVAKLDRSPVVGAHTSSVTSEWTFRSAHVPDSKQVPLPTTAVRYYPALDAAGTAPAGRFGVPVQLESPPRTPGVKNLTVEVSYDDGRSWEPVQVERTGKGWLARVDHPRTRDAWVSLRTKVVDKAGNTTTQSVIRAYQLR